MEKLKLRLIKQNQIKMMQTRGYYIDKKELKILDMDIDGFTEYYDSLDSSNLLKRLFQSDSANKKLKKELNITRTYLSNDYSKTKNGDKTCVVMYLTRSSSSKSIRLEIVKPLLEILKYYTEIIFIADRRLTPESMYLFNGIPMTNDGIPRMSWLFRDEELIINPLTHVLTPKHELLSEEEAIAFRKLYRNPLQISIEDPVVKFNGWPINSVVKITRNIYDVNSCIKELVTKRKIVRDNIAKDIAD